MKAIPAIDVLNGKCVRLTQGDYSQSTIYHSNPLEVAKKFEKAGIDYLHLVDLDGAQKGQVVNWHTISAIQEHTALNIDFGGGVKTEEDVQQLLDWGIYQINIGSIAVKESEKFITWLEKFGADNFILSADVKGESVAVNGWLEKTNFRLYDLIEKFTTYGLSYITVTDIETDGMLNGPNFKLYEDLKNKFPDLKITASGGIRSVEDLEKLKQLGIYAAIIGKALYEGTLQIDDLQLFNNNNNNHHLAY